MVTMYTVPPLEDIETLSDSYGEYRYPNHMPHAVVVEDAVSDESCDTILSLGMTLEGYSHPGCNATTREWTRSELAWPKDLLAVSQLTKYINDILFKFDIDPSVLSWLQTYEAGGDYQLHMDASLGMSRKMTAVILLSDEKDYDGGVLRLLPIPYSFNCPRTRGTVIIFPSWILHEVTEITRGVRQTINMGFWGPPFR